MGTKLLNLIKATRRYRPDGIGSFTCGYFPRVLIPAAPALWRAIDDGRLPDQVAFVGLRYVAGQVVAKIFAPRVFLCTSFAQEKPRNTETVRPR